QPWSRDALNTRQWFDFGGAELREVDGGNRRQSHGTRRCGRRAARGRGARAQRGLDERLDVVVGDTTLEAVPGNSRQIDTQLTRELAHRGSRVCAREARLIDRWKLHACGGCTRLTPRGFGGGRCERSEEHTSEL